MGYTIKMMTELVSLNPSSFVNVVIPFPEYPMTKSEYVFQEFVTIITTCEGSLILDIWEAIFRIGKVQNESK